ncbi:MAG: hypothetical protein AAGC64_02785 [Bacteroidota bacterium]
MEDWTKEELELYNRTQLTPATKDIPIYGRVNYFLKVDDLWISLYSNSKIGLKIQNNGLSKLQNYISKSNYDINELKHKVLLEINEHERENRINLLKQLFKKLHQRLHRNQKILESKNLPRNLELEAEIEDFVSRIFVNEKRVEKPVQVQLSQLALRVRTEIEKETSELLSNAVSALHYWIQVKLKRNIDFKNQKEMQQQKGNDWRNWYVVIRNNDGLGYGTKSVKLKHIKELEKVYENDVEAFNLLMEIQKKIKKED